MTLDFAIEGCKTHFLTWRLKVFPLGLWIEVLNEYTLEGVGYSEWVECPHTFEEFLDFMNY